jgi:hypothetical protein
VILKLINSRKKRGKGGSVMKDDWRRWEIKIRIIPKSEGTKSPGRRMNGLEDNIKVGINKYNVGM